MTPGTGERGLALRIALGATATWVFFFSAFFLPLLGVFLGMLAPLPTAAAYSLWGRKAGLLVPAVALGAGGVGAASLGLAASVLYFAPMLLLGVVLGEGMLRGRPVGEIVGAGALVAFIAGGAVFLGLHAGQGVFSALEASLRDSALALLREYGAKDQAAENAVREMVPVLARIFPGATLSSTIVIAWVNMVAARRIAERRGVVLPPWGNLTLFRAPERLIWVVIAAGILTVLPVSGLSTLAANILIVLGTVYFFQGFAIVVFFCARWRLPRVLRAIVYALVFLQQFVTLAVALLGLFDLWLDLRRRALTAPPARE